MAYVTSASYGGRYLKLECWENATDVVQNYSQVGATLSSIGVALLITQYITGEETLMVIDYGVYLQHIGIVMLSQQLLVVILNI